MGERGGMGAVGSESGISCRSISGVGSTSSRSKRSTAAKYCVNRFHWAVRAACQGAYR